VGERVSQSHIEVDVLSRMDKEREREYESRRECDLELFGGWVLGTIRNFTKYSHEHAHLVLS